MAKRTLFGICSSVLTLIVISSCLKASETPINLPKALDSSGLQARFGKYYTPVPYKVAPSVPAYTLPLKQSDLYNFPKVSQFLGPKGAQDLLLKNGVVTVNWGQYDEVVAAYKQIKKMDVPVFVTSDSLLHLYHIQFDETLKQIEEKEFFPDLVKISQTMQTEFLSRYNSSPEATKQSLLKGVAFFTVGLKLLKPETPVPGAVKKWVDFETEHIEKHAGFPTELEVKNSLFQYAEDYSQYVPRGHYTQSENLKKYFKAMMWYGRMTMLIKGDKKFGPTEKALIPPEEAKTQTILAGAIAALASTLKVDNAPLIDKWFRIYAVSAYYVGFSDDLSIYEYQDALRSVFGNSFTPSQLAQDANFLKFQAAVAKLRKPAIYSGTGAAAIDLDKEGSLKPEQLVEILGKTQGFRFMGQRYVPDSFILGQLVAPTIDKVLGPSVFTTVFVPDYGSVRMFPRGLDVMAVLGSKRAVKVLDNIGDSKYKNYPETLDKLKKQFDAVPEKDWNQNLYWSWLYALKSLTSEPGGKGWPTFTQTDAWKDKQLNAALGSWAALRHDTILYVKQSYTPGIHATSAEPPPPPELPVVGYVEPAPEFYARLVALTRMTQKGLNDLKVLDEQSNSRLTALDQVLSRLLDISTRELANKKLAQDDYDFIKNFADQINAIVTGSGNATQKTTMVADVHTVQNTSQVLEEATGYLRLMLVAYKMPEGHILVGVGPVYSYYEFKQPMSNRLTDEKWREMLGSGKAPALPDWTKSFAIY
jgi:hypothetical protein